MTDRTTRGHRNAVPTDSNQQTNESFYDRSTELATTAAVVMVEVAVAAGCCFGSMLLKHKCQYLTSFESVGNHSSALTWSMAVEGDRENCCSMRCLPGKKREKTEKGRGTEREKYSRHNRIIVVTIISHFFSRRITRKRMSLGKLSNLIFTLVNVLQTDLQMLRV
jgi:hypothetical protein